MKLWKLACGLALLPALSFAQAANISRTDLGPSASTLNLTALQNAATSMWFSNDGETAIVFHGGGTPVTATVVTQKTSVSKEGYGTITLSNETVSIPSATYVIAGPYPAGRFNTGAATIAVSMSSVTGVSATSFRVRGE